MKNSHKFETLDVKAYDDSFLKTLNIFCSTLLGILSGLENAMRQFHPPVLLQLRQALVPYIDRLNQARNEFGKEPCPSGLDRFVSQLDKAANCVGNSLDLFTTSPEPEQAVRDVMRGMKQHARALEALFPLRRIIRPINRYFLEAPVREDLEKFEQDPHPEFETGLFSETADRQGRGNDYAFFVPETYDGNNDWPLVVALHGGYGSGRDFIWLWLREARSRGFLLLAPSSIGRTWSFKTRDDEDALYSIIKEISGKWRIDSDRILLTGMSDGAIYSLTCGLRENSIYTALAPISGVLHPIDLSYAGGKPVYLVHGALDWMFSVQYARQACAILKEAGADVTFREIENLSHTYPREENARILSWFDPALAL